MDLVLIVTAGIYLLASLLLHGYGINAYIMVLLFLRSRRRRRREEQRILRSFAHPIRDADLPVVTTQLPIYNERNVVERLLEAVCAFDYPRDKHEIQILDDSTDDTRELAAGLAARMRALGHDVHHIHRMQRRGYKAGALSEGLRRARGEFVAVFDADFVPPPDFLRRTLPFLLADERCGFVQTRWGHRNRDVSLLTLLQSLGIDGHFVVEQTARCWNGLFFNFNGTAGVWRRRAIEDAGGWQADTLTEDLDLSYRAQLAGWTSRYLLDVVTPAEIPTDMNALKSQQYRWAKGSIQAARKLLPVVWRRSDLGIFRKIQATIHLTQYAVHPLILVVSLLILPLVHLAQFRLESDYVAPLVVIMFLSLFGPSTLYLFAQGVAGRGWVRSWLWLPAMMALGTGLAVNNTRAVLGGLRGAGGEFVRTPKLGGVAERRRRMQGSAETTRSLRIYWQPKNGICLLEILMGVWALAAFLGTLDSRTSLAGPFLLVQAAGFGWVGILSVMHERERRREGAGMDPGGRAPDGAGLLAHGRRMEPARDRTPD